jgi:hypothetical protein
MIGMIFDTMNTKKAGNYEFSYNFSTKLTKYILNNFPILIPNHPDLLLEFFVTI